MWLLRRAPTAAEASTAEEVSKVHCCGRRRRLSSIGMSLDGYNRWGKDRDPKFKAHATRQLADSKAVAAELTALSRTLLHSERPAGETVGTGGTCSPPPRTRGY